MLPQRQRARRGARCTPVAPGTKLELPVGTRLPLVLHNGITTRIAKPGDPVYLETLFPVIVDGKIMVPAGSYVSGEVTEAKRAGRVKGRAEINLSLKVLILPNGYIVNFAGAPAGAGTGGGETMDNEGKIKGDSDKASDAGTVAKTTAAGAGIGAIAGGVKGLGIGAGTGAALGLAAVLLSRGPGRATSPRHHARRGARSPIYLDADKIQFTDPGHASTLPGPANREPQRSRVPVLAYNRSGWVRSIKEIPQLSIREPKPIRFVRAAQDDRATSGSLSLRLDVGS